MMDSSDVDKKPRYIKKRNSFRKPSNKSSPDMQVDLRELLKSKKKKDKSRSVDDAFDSPPVKRKKSNSEW